LLFAVVLFGIAVRDNSPLAGLSVVFATLLVAAALWIDGKSAARLNDKTSETRLMAAVLVFAVLGALGWASSTIGSTSDLLERLPSLGWAALAIGLYATRGAQDTKRSIAGAITVLALGITLVVGVLHLNAVQGVGLDVYLLHTQAADALANGQNPYTDVVEVPNGAPTAAPGETIVGYPYPPVTAIAYAAGEWTMSDARYTSLASWLVLLASIGGFAIKAATIRFPALRGTPSTRRPATNPSDPEYVGPRGWLRVPDVGRCRSDIDPPAHARDTGR
jgi:hypothetical protein